MPLLHSLKIRWCGNLKSLPDYLLNTPLQELDIYGCPILKQHCERRIGDFWRNISHIPKIKICARRRPIGTKTPMKTTPPFAPSPQLASTPPTRVEALARLGSPRLRKLKIKTENLSYSATVKTENSDGTKDGGAEGTGTAGPTGCWLGHIHQVIMLPRLENLMKDS
ncbi:uncharacterized protein LOC136068766 isoform X2 [Quercus suber]|uniref:uncharacterized protein LOC136068766 isoform X2 n=1 Tax=Quercus suber TaxID=58331 RepID=UPI0032DE83CD